MSTDSESRQPLLKISPPDQPPADRKPRVQESLDTLILGAISTSIGIVLMIALFAGVARRPIRGWNERAITGAAPYYIPSKDCAIAAFAGEFLGLAGILLARCRHGTISPLSTLGTVIALGHIYLFFFYVSLMEFL